MLGLISLFYIVFSYQVAPRQDESSDSDDDDDDENNAGASKSDGKQDSVRNAYANDDDDYIL